MLPALIGGGLLGGAAGFLGSQKKVNTDPYGTLNPEQKALVQQMGPELQKRMFTPAEQYSGEYSAPLTANEQEMVARNARLSALGEQGFTNLLKGEFPEQYYQDAIYKPMMKQYQEDVQPLIEEQYAGPSGYWGSARADAVSKGYRDLTDTLAAQRAALGYQAKRDVMDAATAYNTFEQGNAGIQSIPRVVQQYGLDKKYAEWVRTRPESLPYINYALNFLNLSTVTQTEESKYGALPYILGGLGSALSTYGAMGGGSGSSSTSSDPRGTQGGYNAYLQNQNRTTGIPWQTA